MHHVLDTVGDDPIILGVSDVMVGQNRIDRVRWIAETEANHVVTRAVSSVPALENFYRGFRGCGCPKLGRGWSDGLSALVGGE